MTRQGEAASGRARRPLAATASALFLLIASALALPGAATAAGVTSYEKAFAQLADIAPDPTGLPRSEA